MLWVVLDGVTALASEVEDWVNVCSVEVLERLPVEDPDKVVPLAVPVKVTLDVDWLIVEVEDTGALVEELPETDEVDSED